MNDAELVELHSELLALQAVLMGVFRRLARERPELTPLFCHAFDDAETILTGVATRAGMEHAIGTTTGALRVIEELRQAVIGTSGSCD